MNDKKTERAKQIDSEIRFVGDALEALTDMKAQPDEPTDLSQYSIGALRILKKECGVIMLHSGGDVFGLMSLDTEKL